VISVNHTSDVRLISLISGVQISSNVLPLVNQYCNTACFGILGACSFTGLYRCISPQLKTGYVHLSDRSSALNDYRHKDAASSLVMFRYFLGCAPTVTNERFETVLTWMWQSSFATYVMFCIWSLNWIVPRNAPFLSISLIPRSPNRVAVISAKNHKRQRRTRQSVTAKREKSQTPKVLTALLTLPNLT